ncbi:MAG: DUF1326 domain-containing protein [Synechococcaceae cyanobacterium]|nr:DUF1326 domain-containing protein [Synechococcaceae cyanobacterium]
MATNWNLNGVYAEVCTCAAICPCITLSDPTLGTCTALVSWHVDKGRCGDVTLDGLNVAVGLHTPGNMAAKDWTAVLYLDERADEEQREALSRIFSGQAGGHPAAIAEHIATVAGVRTVPIHFESDGRSGRIQVGHAGEAEWQPIEGQDGGLVTVQGNPLAIAPGHPAVVGRASRARWNEAGMGFDVAGRQAMVSPFSYAA